MSGKENEKSTDRFVRDMLQYVGFSRPWEQSISDAPAYLYEAMEGASKSLGGGRGKPEFVVESGEFIIVIEDKPRVEELVKLTDEGSIDLAYPARKDFALNGAVHYAEAFAAKTSKKVFAIGVAGSETHHVIQVAFSAPQRAPKTLDNQIDTFTSFTPDAIDEFYRVAVLGELPPGREERS
ncbi:hypothetical protein V5S96_09205 [Corynebacterium mastitidis]|uniref:Restriction endonuclease n=1 Tax=Corynebacterium mastitidis TaxID=161890 RepID=A0ABU8P0I7_9CORY